MATHQFEIQYPDGTPAACFLTVRSLHVHDKVQWLVLDPKQIDRSWHDTEQQAIEAAQELAATYFD